METIVTKNTNTKGSLGVDTENVFSKRNKTVSKQYV